MANCSSKRGDAGMLRWSDRAAKTFSASDFAVFACERDRDIPGDEAAPFAVSRIAIVVGLAPSLKAQSP
jgi:hypothetical protein